MLATRCRSCASPRSVQVGAPFHHLLASRLGTEILQRRSYPALVAAWFPTTEIAEQENERGLGELHDRVNILKKVDRDIHEEVESHNKLLEGMGNAMDASRSLMAGTMDPFTKVFETKSSCNIATIVASCVVVFLLIYYLAR